MRKLIVFMMLCTSFSAIAQTETEIRNHYQDVNKKIQSSKEQGYEGELYCNEWVTNKNSKSWPAVGNYNETTSFWYDDDPNHLNASERDPKLVLLKVTIQRKASHLSTNEEYLFKNGKLVFYFKDEGEEGRTWATRMYFNAKGMFKSSVKADDKELTAKDFLKEDYKDFKPNPVAVVKDSRNYQELFLKSMR